MIFNAHTNIGCGAASNEGATNEFRGCLIFYFWYTHTDTKNSITEVHLRYIYNDAERKRQILHI